MKKMPFRLAPGTQYAYAVQVEDGTTYGPYKDVTSAKKAAGRAGLRAKILRLEITVESEEVTEYNPK